MRPINAFSRTGLFVLSFVTMAGAPFDALAQNEPSKPSIEEFLREFHANPAEVMDRAPVKWNERGELVSSGSGLFSRILPDTGLSEEAFEAKKEIRNWVIERSGKSLMSPFGDDDRPEDLVYSPNLVTSLVEIDQMNLRSGSSVQSPWADSYWPIYKGLLGARYADGGFPHSKDWSANFAYVMGVPSGAVPYNVRSPSEKYDTLVGDTSFSLTRWNWNKGKWYQQKYGRVASWMGICHGWAAAAHMLEPVAKKSFTVTAANGGQITFYPSDIKGLRSLLWAEAFTPTRFLGKRCEIRRPKKDSAGRVIDEGCFDTNPGTLFLTLVNQMGIGRRSFVMDATFDEEVWNYPLQKYKFTYFNPQTHRPVHHLDLAAVPVEQYGTDVFRSYRSPNAAFIVGVSLELTYVNVYGPIRGLHKEPPTKTAQYIFDLELDSRMNVIGGEWYTNKHPDFLWTFNPGQRAYGDGDHLIGANTTWDGSGPIPESWRAAAAKSSSAGEPMAAIVDVLARLGSDAMDDGIPEEGENDTTPPPNSEEPPTPDHADREAASDSSGT